MIGKLFALYIKKHEKISLKRDFLADVKGRSVCDNGRKRRRKSPFLFDRCTL